MKILVLFLLSSFIFLGQTQKAFSAESSSIMEMLRVTEQDLSNIKLEIDESLSNIDTNLVNFNRLIDIFNKFKQDDIKFALSLVTKIKSHDTLSGEEIYVLRQVITTYYKLNTKLLDFAHLYDSAGGKMSSDFANANKDLLTVKAHLIWLSAHLLVLDHLETIHTILYRTDDVFRRIVKNALIDKETDEFEESKTVKDLLKINAYTVEIGESAKFGQQINLVLGSYEDLKKLFLDVDEKEAVTLLQEIVQNKTSKDIAQGKTKFQINTYSFIDSVYQVVNKTLGWVSKIFGNFAGSIRTRHGHFFRKEAPLLKARENLRPMDILLDKTPFILTDRLIPGYFGHAAIYLGTKEQLEGIGMWDHVDIVPYQKEIEAGKVILEAVREGVRLSTLEDFMNIDEMIILRQKDVLENRDLLFDKYSRGMNQIGKQYDFNFDVSTLDKIVCSELIYIVFGNVHWTIKYRLGRPTFSPDNIAEILFHTQTKFNIQSFLVSKEDRRKNRSDMTFLADELDYEMRTSSGGPVQDSNDSSNNYWKKFTKCYVVENSTYDSEQSSQRVCETKYVEYKYQEIY